MRAKSYNRAGNSDVKPSAPMEVRENPSDGGLLKWAIGAGIAFAGYKLWEAHEAAKAPTAPTTATSKALPRAGI